MGNDTTDVALTRSRCCHRALSRARRLALLLPRRRTAIAPGPRRAPPRATIFYWTMSVVGGLGAAPEAGQLEP
jgi:hypothetical protein